MILISPFCFYTNSYLNIFYQIFVTIILCVLSSIVNKHLVCINRNDLLFWIYSTLWKSCLLISFFDNALSYLLHYCNECQHQIEITFLFVRIIILLLGYYNYNISVRYKLYKRITNMDIITNFIQIILYNELSLSQKLKKFQVKSLNFNICNICFEEYNRNIVRLSCGHEFHKKCIQKWFNRCFHRNINITCPNCRYLFSEI